MTDLCPSGSIDRVLTDGSRELRGAAIRDAVDTLIAQLRAQRVGTTDIVAFHCEHDLPGALLWLALLEGGFTAFVSATDPRTPAVDPPPFCRSRVSAHWHDDRVQLSVQARPGWNGVSADGTARMLFRTSGSTGAPKFAAHRTTQLIGNARNCVERFGLSASDRVAIPVPVYHMYGFGAAYLPAMLAGASVDIQPGSNLLRFIERETTFAPTVAYLTPGFMRTLVAGRRGARPYRLTVTAGDRLDPEVARAYESAFGPVVSLYGSTELGAVAAASVLDPPAVRAGTVGRPMAGVDCRIDEQLRCRHPYGFDGYMDEDGALHARSEEGWFATNDRAAWLDDTWLRILGRADQRVNRDGVLVPLGDIEAAMQGIAGIGGVVVVVAGESARGAGVVACCVRAAGAVVDAGQVRRACFDRMPRSHVPDRVWLLDAYPLLPSGKPDRVALARGAAERAW